MESGIVRRPPHPAVYGHRNELTWHALAAPVDSAHLARSVRRDTADIASYALSHRQHGVSPGLLGRTLSHSPPASETSTLGPGRHGGAPQNDPAFRRASFSQIAPAFQSPGSRANAPQESPSMLTNLLRGSPPAHGHEETDGAYDVAAPSSSDEEAEDSGDGEAVTGGWVTREASRLETVPELDEQTPLLSSAASKQSSVRGRPRSRDGDLEAQGAGQPSTLRRLGRRARSRAGGFATVLTNPRKWDGRAIWHCAVVAPASYLPAVLVGLLLNILDALSYGKFPPPSISV